MAYFLFFTGLLIVAISIPLVIKQRKEEKENEQLSRITSMGLDITEVQESVDQLMTELTDTTEKIITDVDTRAIELKALINEADRKIDLLRRMTEQDEVLPVQPFVKPNIVPVMELMAAKQEQGNHQKSNNDKVIDLLERKKEKILELASQGWRVSDIAKAVNMGQGEVKLILQLKAREPISEVN